MELLREDAGPYFSPMARTRGSGAAPPRTSDRRAEFGPRQTAGDFVMVGRAFRRRRTGCEADRGPVLTTDARTDGLTDTYRDAA